MTRAIRWIRERVTWILAAALTVPFGAEALAQIREDAFVHETALRVVREAHAETPKARVLALRDYVRAHVSFRDAPAPEGDHDSRPFLRATAEETLRSGLGYCGEDSRVFINLARSIGIESQRVNLYGSTMHVVAEVELEPHRRMIVDAQNPPLIPELELLDNVILRPEYDDYYTLNLRRLHLGWLVSRVRLEMGPLTYWLENPHALSAALWGVLIACVVGAKLGRIGLRKFLHHRGWIHRSALAPGALAPGALAPGLLDAPGAPRRAAAQSEPASATGDPVAEHGHGEEPPGLVAAARDVRP